jgi:hypothetical protein
MTFSAMKTDNYIIKYTTRQLNIREKQLKLKLNCFFIYEIIMLIFLYIIMYIENTK